ncbi:hypothetical protein [Salinicoccus roseus]|uniref:hypothetical protein n=1 Tax=Salinicoccus roseus TaxID=45670 RepID=UPI001EF60F08|nr:hypothetical protein [Salinicoccus roseus]MCG7333638.1 hypothetical protein [Salinicoccus roseus]
MYIVELTEYAKSDYEKLDGSQKQLILKGLKRIKERGMQAGEALRDELVNGSIKMVLTLTWGKYAFIFY